MSLQPCQLEVRSPWRLADHACGLCFASACRDLHGRLAGMQVADVAAAALQIKKKMTREEFVRNNRGINGTKDNPQDLPPEFLTELYNHFSKKAIRFPQLPSTLSQKHSNSGDLTVMKCALGHPVVKDRVYLVFIIVLLFQQHPTPNCQPRYLRITATAPTQGSWSALQSPPKLAL